MSDDLRDPDPIFEPYEDTPWHWERVARRIYRIDRESGVWGSGPFAVVAHCRAVTVSLWQTREDAETAIRKINQGACGGFCVKNHEIVDLRDRVTRRSRCRRAHRLPEDSDEK